MKISLVVDKSLCRNEIVLTCYKKDDKLEKIVKYIKGLATPIIGCLNNSDHVLDCNDILYIESVDNQTFLYTNNHVFNSKEKLVTLEANLIDASFLRISKSVIINLNKVKSISPLINRNLSIEMNNGEFLICSRRYVKSLKISLGMR